MYTTETLIKSIKEQFNILKHLGTKVNEENQHAKTSDKTRTIIELEKYLAFEAPGQINMIQKGGWDGELYKTWIEKGASFSFNNFATKMDEAYSYIEETIKGLSEEQLNENMEMRGMNGTRMELLVNYFLVFLGAYKMQLFLQIKSSGNTDIGTWNLWAGMDEPKKD